MNQVQFRLRVKPYTWNKNSTPIDGVVIMRGKDIKAFIPYEKVTTISNKMIDLLEEHERTQGAGLPMETPTSTPQPSNPHRTAEERKHMPETPDHRLEAIAGRSRFRKTDVKALIASNGTTRTVSQHKALVDSAGRPWSQPEVFTTDHHFTPEELGWTQAELDDPEISN